MTSSDDQAQKPDASPRRFWIHREDGPDHMEEPSNPQDCIHVIEKSAYDELQSKLAHKYKLLNDAWEEAGLWRKENDALAKRVAELEQMRSVDIPRIEALTSELAAAKAENIGNLQLIGALQDEIERFKLLNERLQADPHVNVIRYFELGDKLTQANARIKELEAQADAKEEYCGLQRRVQADMKEREQNLVAALERYAEHDRVLRDARMDGSVAREALKAHKGGA